MSERQQVWKLMMFEIRNFKPTQLLKFVLYMGLSLTFLKVVFETPGSMWALDFLIIPVSWVLHMGVRRKAFYLSYNKGSLYATPLQIILRTMPFSINTIIKARLFLFLSLNIIVQTILVLILFTILPATIQELTPLPAWIIVWNVLTIVIACSIVIGEAGASYSKVYLFVFNVITIILLFALHWLVQLYLGSGIVSEIYYYTAYHPVTASVIALIVLVITTLLAFYYMKQYMCKVDYHV
ncbi:hypothetical protein NSQ54_17825 [Alkalihalobacillus sp. FSL W8-0930]